MENKTTQMNNTNPELPVEVENALYTEAEEIYNKLNDLAQEQDPYDFGLPMCNKVKAPIEAALTSYATKLLQEKEAVKILQKTCAKYHAEIGELKKENEKLIATATGWRPLLEEVLKLDDFEIAHISDELFEKIKRFLYGE